MPSALAIALATTDVAFLLYWTLAALSQAGPIQIPPDWMYASYEQVDVIAWHWSFLPMDLAFSYFSACVQSLQLGVRIPSGAHARSCP